MKNLSVVIVVLCGLGALLLAVPSDAQVKKGKTRAMLTRHLMAGLVKVQCGDLKKGLDAGPSDDKAWAALEINAALLNEASYVLMEDGRCPDATWAKAAGEILRSGSAGVLAAIGARDVDAAKKAFGDMTKACGTCHKAHKSSS